ncbi:MAG: AAA family ATPase [Candidatus Omnitrophota bacterium]
MNTEKGLKQIPYGVSDFREIRKNNYYYVDKTRFIRDIERSGVYLTFHRPPLFGKSLLLSTMEAYYDIRAEDEFDFLFEGTDIHENPTKEKNSYLVFKLDFSKVDTDLEKVEASFLAYMKEAASDFVIKYEKYLHIDLEEAKERFNEGKSATDILGTLIHFCDGWRRDQPKVYVMIDEYDSLALNLFVAGGEFPSRESLRKEMFMGSFFTVLKAGTTGSGAPFSRIFLSGTFPISLDNITSGFNIAWDISDSRDINQVAGFNPIEIQTMIDYYKRLGWISQPTEELLAMLHQWYGGYRFAERARQDVFNSTMVLYFVKELIKNSVLPQEMIDQWIWDAYRKFRHLIESYGKISPENGDRFSVLKEVFTNGSVELMSGIWFSLRRLNRSENFIYFLFYVGLLTIGGSALGGLVYNIPNEAVRRIYAEYIDEAGSESPVE